MTDGPATLNGVRIEDTFAEAFPMRGARAIITAATLGWARTAATAMTGFATSVIACGCEAGIERELSPELTPDGRPGVAVLLFGMDDKAVGSQLQARVGQCVLTCPSAACFAGIEPYPATPREGHARVALGKGLRYFADGFQVAKKLGATRYWRLPVMEGEFVVEDEAASVPGVGGGNFLILATAAEAARGAAEEAIEAMRRIEGVIMPFPGGIVRSGSKIGGKYKGMIASTNDAFCPTLKGQSPNSVLPPEVESVLEIVIDGLSEAAVARATRVGVEAACRRGRAGGIVAVSAGNYGGQLGPYHFHLRQVLA